MAGIYIHIPFCKKKCSYCNFPSIASRKYLQEFAGALKKEIEAQSSFFLNPSVIETIYFGGGTPSLLTANELDEILEHISKHFSIAQHPELTIELNPDDVTLQYAQNLKKVGFNRLSIGVQSFSDKELAYMGRIHTAQTSLQSVHLLKNAGFENISADIIFGLPSQYTEPPDFQLKYLSELLLQHISLYCLTVEPDTILHHQIALNKLIPPDEDIATEQFRFYMNHLPQLGFVQYEISNYAQAGFESRHNSSYWQGIPYLGLGAGAHSYDGEKRFWNTPYVLPYIKQIESGENFREFEVLSETDKYNETVMSGLRTHKGVSTEFLIKRFGEQLASYFLKNIEPYLRQKLVMQTEQGYVLTNEGRLFADKIISACFALNTRTQKKS